MCPLAVVDPLYSGCGCPPNYCIWGVYSRFLLLTYFILIHFSEFGLYRTRIREGDSGLLECRYRYPRDGDEMIGEILTIGDDVRIIFSPGYLYQDRYVFRSRIT